MARCNGGDLGLIVLPIMFYHQLQLVVCSVLAERYAGPGLIHLIALSSLSCALAPRE